MDKNINKQKPNKIMKSRLILITSLFLLMISNVFSASLYYTQPYVINDYNLDELGFSLENIVLGNDNTRSIGTQDGDIKYELRDLDLGVYFLVDNAFVNTTLNITYVNDNPLPIDSNVTKNAITQELTMEEVGFYYFKLEPAYSGENVDIMFDFDDSNVHTIILQEAKPQGFNSLLSGMVNAFESIIDYNIGIWKITFYALIFAFSSAFILGIFGLAFTIFSYSKKLKNKNEGD